MSSSEHYWMFSVKGLDREYCRWLKDPLKHSSEQEEMVQILNTAAEIHFQNWYFGFSKGNLTTVNNIE